MTRDRAIQVLREMKNLTYVATDSRCSAIDMAVEALQREEAEAKGYCHRIKPKVYQPKKEKENGTFVNRDNCNFNCNDSNRTLVDVVRCKDCKNNYNTCTNHGTNQPMCDFTDRMLKETDFCSRGERREP